MDQACNRSARRGDSDRWRRVLVNGTPLPQEYYRHSEDLYEYQFPYASFSPLVLGPNEVFVMGDNTEESDDSRPGDR